MRQHHLAQRTLRPLPGANRLDDLTAKRAVVEQHHIGVEQRDFLRPYAGAQFFAYSQHFGTHGGDRLLEQPHLGLRVRALRLGTARMSAGGETTTTRPTAIPGEPATPANFRGAHGQVARITTNAAGGSRVRDHPGKLRRQRDQEGFLFLVETALLALLHHQHAEDLPMVDDRYAKEGFEYFLAGAFDELEVRMRLGVFEVQRLRAACDESDQPLVQRQAEAAFERLVQSLGGHEHVAIGGRIVDVDRTHLGPHRLAYPAHDDRQCLGQIDCTKHFLRHPAQRFQHRAWRCLSAHCARAGRGAERVPTMRGGRPRA